MEVRRSGEERTKNMLTTWMSIGANCTVKGRRERNCLYRERGAEKEDEHKQKETEYLRAFLVSRCGSACGLQRP